MNRFVIAYAAIALVASGFVCAGFAHHSIEGSFDTTTEMTVEGEIIEFQWTNPHIWVWMNVEGPDGVTRWGLEGMSPNFLRRRGWDKNALKPGDHVRVLIFPLKNGQAGGTFLRVTFEDDTEKIMWNRRASR